MNHRPQHRLVKPDAWLGDFVYCFSSVQNLSGIDDGIIIPNGRIDVFFYQTADQQLNVSLIGLETEPKRISQPEISGFFAVNFNPLAVEYILQFPIADLLNASKLLPEGFLGIKGEDLADFDQFCQKVSEHIQLLLPLEIDRRKQQLFELVFASNGEMPIRELAERVNWSARQINQYFNRQFGLSLKAYCKILRFQASLAHIREGQLFPQLNYYDQSHFIKETKKLSGVSPKELYLNPNSRFLQFSVDEVE